MKILVAEDEPIARLILVRHLEEWGHEVLEAKNGEQALDMVQEQKPRVFITDWLMPGIAGLELCRRVRKLLTRRYVYVMMITARSDPNDLLKGLDAGADDYSIKPFVPEELRLRLRAANRMLTLEDQLAKRIDELERAMERVRQLEGLLPICSYCKKIRGGDIRAEAPVDWHQIESFVEQRSGAQFSHSVCPTCFEKHLQSELGISYEDLIETPDGPSGE